MEEENCIFECKNDWTKQKMLDVLKKRKYTTKSINDVSELDLCVYLSASGNKCGVGMFIPDGHEGQYFIGNLQPLIENYPDLKKIFPLNEIGMRLLQIVHDFSKTSENVKQKMIDWVVIHVEDNQYISIEEALADTATFEMAEKDIFEIYNENKELVWKSKITPS